jgi:hypothetical protein
MLEKVFAALRETAPFMPTDEVLHYRMAAAEQLLNHDPTTITGR